MTCDICESPNHFRRDCPKGKGKGSSVSVNLAQGSEDIEYVDYDFFLSPPAGPPASAAVYFIMARYAEAAVALALYAEELMHDLHGDTFADGLGLEEWIYIPFEADQTAHAEPSADAGPPASVASDSDGCMPCDMDLSEPETIPATEIELTQMLGRPYLTLDNGLRGHPLQDQDLSAEDKEALGMDLDEAVCLVATTLRSRERGRSEPSRGTSRPRDPRAKLRARAEAESSGRRKK